MISGWGKSSARKYIFFFFFLRKMSLECDLDDHCEGSGE